MRPGGDGATRKKLDYGRTSEQIRPLGGVQYVPPIEQAAESDYARMVRRSIAVDTKLISVIAGGVFLLGAFAAAVRALPEWVDASEPTQGPLASPDTAEVERVIDVVEQLLRLCDTQVWNELQEHRDILKS